MELVWKNLFIEKGKMQNSIVYSCLCFKNDYKSYMHFYVHKNIVRGYRKSPLGWGSGILNDREISF